MTLDEALARVNAVGKAAADGDDEGAHEKQDALWRDVLQEIAVGTLPLEKVRELANAALNTTMIEFSRWYA